MLCDLYRKIGKGDWSHGALEEDTVTDRSFIPNANKENADIAVLPPEVMEWSGLKRSNPRISFQKKDKDQWESLKLIFDSLDDYDDEEVVYDLSELNDDGGSFDQIASFIELGL